MAIPGHLLALGQSVIEVRVMSEVKLVDDAHRYPSPSPSSHSTISLFIALVFKSTIPHQKNVSSCDLQGYLSRTVVPCTYAQTSVDSN